MDHGIRQGRDFYKYALRLMFPMIIQNLISNTLALCDTFMVGALGETQLAAITVANTPFFVLMIMTFGLQSGTGVLVAQYHGKGDSAAINRVMGMGLYFILAITIAVSVVVSVWPREMMGLFTNNAELIGPGAEYSRIVCWSYVFSGISLLYIGVQRSMENARLGAYILGASGVLNIFLNWVFIFGKLGAPRMGAAGAALATLICRILEVAAVAVYAARCKYFRVRPRLVLRPGRAIGKDFLRYAVPVVCGELFWSLSQSLFTVIMGHMQDSTQILAAYTVSGNVDRIMCVAIYAAGNATAIIIGREIGLGRSDTVYGKAVALSFLNVIIGAVSGVLILLVRATVAESWLYPLMGLSAGSVDCANLMLLMLAVSLPVRAVVLTDIVGVCRGGGDVRFAMLTDTVPMYLFAVPGAALCGLVLNAGIFWTYFCMLSVELLKGILIFFRIRSRRWINDVTRAPDLLEAEKSAGGS